MKNIVLFILLLTPLLGLAHPIHVSVCEMKENTEEGTLEITIKIFADDFSHVLSERTGKKVHLGFIDEHKNTDAFILDYLSENLKIEINGMSRELEWKFKEVEDVATWCHLTVPITNKIEVISITNSVMMQKFRDQVNVVHLECNDKMNSTFFSVGKETDTFNFK